MTKPEFLSQLDARIAKYDLLSHPFYQAWAEGKLTRDDLREYAQDYYQHVRAFPGYLAAFALRLEDSPLRSAVLANLAEEQGVSSDGSAVPHDELWLDFAEGMGASRDFPRHPHQPLPEVAELIAHFEKLASEAAPDECLAAFYAYESQVPRVAEEKARGLKERYGVDDKSCGYFTLHATADVFHSRVWRNQLAKQVEANPAAADRALSAAEAAAQALWHALDGIEARRSAQTAA
jgi:pyrroloquinoline-quinone synthase